MLRILGIDPGVHGSYALYAFEAWDFPVHVYERGRIDAVLLAELIREINPDHAWVEFAAARPGQGVSSVYSYGYSNGIIHGVLGTLKIPVTIVTPAQWKRALRVPKDKDGARARATQLMPRQAQQWSRVKDHGRAEAALIAYYGWTQMGQGHERTATVEYDWA